MILKEVSLGAVSLSTGKPKVAVTLAARQRETLIGQAAQVLTSPAQIVTWRLNDYQELDNRAELINTAAQLKRVLGTIPIIATVALTATASTTEIETAYQAYQTLINNRAVAAVSIDMVMVQQASFTTLAAQIRAQGIKLILRTACSANQEQIVAAYEALAAAGADVATVTVAGQSASAIVTLMAATTQAHQNLSLPLVATAHGTLGRFNSVCGQLTGSAIVYGRVGRVGDQSLLPVSQLQRALQILQEG
ncbi:type I 3-dehydroquinate dehydratase [Lactiplantibacillus modestisalitolerans]|uniref:Type I 3-dehydroquinate dehydratase n=1 Tax=Lactiplantibacillus modestisalitolerans TaxID=1457219 RepID=A0ABV5WWD5_9LACO|nr:type I 3-dehydroquinate dehydratase [Lactiplantibacillus modestisalitolerans]